MAERGSNSHEPKAYNYDLVKSDVHFALFLFLFVEFGALLMSSRICGGSSRSFCTPNVGHYSHIGLSSSESYQILDDAKR